MLRILMWEHPGSYSYCIYPIIEWYKMSFMLVYSKIIKCNDARLVAWETIRAVLQYTYLKFQSHWFHHGALFVGYGKLCLNIKNEQTNINKTKIFLPVISVIQPDLGTLAYCVGLTKRKQWIKLFLNYTPSERLQSSYK